MLVFSSRERCGDKTFHIPKKRERGSTTAKERPDESLLSSALTAAGAKARSAFTLIELLVVIAIIGILSSVVLASLSGARDSAQVSVITQNFRQVETAFIAWSVGERWSSWPDESSFGSSSNTDYPNLEFLVENTDLGDYLPAVADSGLSRPFHYVKSGSEEIRCGMGVRRGVSIATWGVPSEDIASDIDEIIDSGDGGTCGRVQWVPDQNPRDIDLYYKIEGL